MNLKVGGERGWCEWLCVFILGGSASWEQCWSGVRPNWLANYRCLFWLCLYVSHCSAWMREQSPGRSNETLRFIGSARRPPIRNNWAPSESSQGGILIQQFKGMKFRALSSASGRELPKILVNINAFFFLGQGGTRSVPDKLLYATSSFSQEMKSCLHFTNKTKNVLAHSSSLILKVQSGWLCHCWVGTHNPYTSSLPIA